MRFAACAALALVAASGCEDPDVYLPYDEFGGPAGIIDGTLSYTGEMPCTRNQHVIGAAVLLAFDTRLLPPPDGLGTTAASVAAVPGEQLFASIRSALTFNGDGSSWCPDPKTTDPVTVGATWAIGPLPGASYEIRGFYDRNGDFDPVFSISNQPTKGDVAGGALDNAAEAAAGEPPRFRQIALGSLQPDGTRTIARQGARASGVAVTLGLRLPLHRPVFYPKAVIDATPLENKNPLSVTIPSDLELTTFSAANPAGTESSLVRIVLGAGVADGEVDAALASPFFLPVKNPTLTYARQDVNRDGVLDAEDHVPESTALPSLLPLAVFAKLSDSPLVGQSRPAVLLQGLTLYKSLTDTALSQPDLNESSTEVIAAVRPSVVCIDPLDPSRPATLTVSRAADKSGNPLIADEDSVKASLKAQFGREATIAYGCLPEGRYSMNLVYDSGQAWTTPNEAGICAPAEPSSPDGTRCGSRARLESQTGTLTIGPPDDPSYCAKNPTPLACLQ